MEVQTQTEVTTEPGRFWVDQQRVARMMRGLSDVSRLRILGVLAEGEHVEKAIVFKLGLPQPRVSRHLSFLVRAGLVCRRRSGRNALWSLNVAEPLPREVLKSLVRFQALTAECGSKTESVCESID